MSANSRPSALAPQTPQTFAVASERLGADHRIAPAGELDVSTVVPLELELIRVEQTDAEAIEIDLAGLTFIDCSGVNLLWRANVRSRAARLRLLAAPTAVQKVFQLVNVEKFLPFVTPTPPAVTRLH